MISAQGDFRIAAAVTVTGKERCRMDKRTQARIRILNYALNHRETSKAELSRKLDISMPTVLSNVNDLVSEGILKETGTYESTGGRKAKSIGINGDYCTAVGVVITANHLEMALVDLAFEIRAVKRMRLKFAADTAYSKTVAEEVHTFVRENSPDKSPIGTGVAIPGILDAEGRIIVKSHALGLENYSLQFLRDTLGSDVHFENDANAAMLAEDIRRYPNAIYLSLNNTLGGAFCINGELFTGMDRKAGEFGHMILHPSGRKCYCSKKGCADAYCSAGVLTNNGDITLEIFMKQVESGEAEAVRKWDTYLGDLALLISNLRMAYDMTIILGGDVGGILEDHMIPLKEKVMKLDLFDRDASFLTTCSFKKEASAVGSAKYFLIRKLLPSF